MPSPEPSTRRRLSGLPKLLLAVILLGVALSCYDFLAIARISSRSAQEARQRALETRAWPAPSGGGAYLETTWQDGIAGFRLRANLAPPGMAPRPSADCAPFSLEFFGSQGHSLAKIPAAGTLDSASASPAAGAAPLYRSRGAFPIDQATYDRARTWQWACHP